MATTNFVDQETSIVAAWLNDVDQVVYDPDGANYVDYTPTGTGAVVSSVQNKLAKSIHSSDFDTIQHAADTGKKIHFSSGTFSMADVQLHGQSLLGDGIVSTTLLASGTSEVLRLGYVSSPSQWAYKGIESLTINGNVKVSNGVVFKDTGTTNLSGRWALTNITITACNIGIYKPTGNIGNTFSNITITGCNYGYYAKDDPSVMHSGADTFIGGEIDSNALAGIYIDSNTLGTGGTQFRGTIIENNPGFGIFVKNYNTGYTPLLLDGVWFENNATSGSVTINGTPYTPKDIYLENTQHAVLQNGYVPKVQLVNSHLTIQNARLDDTSTYSIDSNSVCTANGVHLNGGAHPVEIKNIISCERLLGNFAPRFRTAPRNVEIKKPIGTVLQAITYADANTYSFTGTGPVTATSIADGIIFDSCAELIIPAAYTLIQPAITITANRWYLLTIDTNFISGTFADLEFSFKSSASAFANFQTVMKTAGWTSLAAMGKADSAPATFTAGLYLKNNGASPMTIRLSALQVIEFTSEQAMLEYFNSGAYSDNNTVPRRVYSTVAPTTGTWAIGDQCINKVKTVGQPKGWFCTVAGTPGTWVSEGNL